MMNLYQKSIGQLVIKNQVSLDRKRCLSEYYQILSSHKFNRRPTTSLFFNSEQYTTKIMND